MLRGVMGTPWSRASRTRGAHDPIRPQQVSFDNDGLTLGGYLFRPDGNGPFPAVMILHGSEPQPGDKADSASVFTAQGYLVFVPHRRGQGLSPGEHIMDTIQRASEPDREARLIELLEVQQTDVQAALRYLVTLDEVDASAVLLLGASFGGIQTLLTLEHSDPVRAAVAASPAAMVWDGHPAIQARLLRAVGKAQIPVLFIQAENDYDLRPTEVLTAELTRLGRPVRRVLFPAIGTTSAEGHRVMARPDLWAAEVLPFFQAARRS